MKFFLQLPPPHKFDSLAAIAKERKAYRQFVHIIIIIIIKGIYIAQVRKGHKCAMSAEMAVWLGSSRLRTEYDTQIA